VKKENDAGFAEDIPPSLIHHRGFI